MEKIMRGVLLTLLVLAATGVANAGWTTVVYTAPPVVSEVTLGQSYQWGDLANNIGWHYTVDWDHVWAIPSDPDFTSVDLIGAELAIQSQFTSDKTESVRVDSLANPSLGDLVNGTKTFDVLSYESVLDGDVTVYATLFDNAPEDSGRVILDKSTLTLTYEITKRVWEDDPIPEPPTVPVPGAIVLGSLGAGLVGLLRRRGTV